MMRLILAVLLVAQSCPAVFAESALSQIDRIIERSKAGGSLEQQAVDARFEESLGLDSPTPALRAPSPKGRGNTARRAKEGGALSDKAELFQERTDQEHRPWLGLILSRRVDAKGEYQRYDDFGDSLIWTGNYVASQAYRYAVTHEEDALKSMEESLWGLHADHEATGVPGLVARVVVPKSEAAKLGFVVDWRRHEGAGAYKDYLWEGNVSFDAYTGYIFGIAAAWPYIRDPKLRDAICEDMRQVGLHIIRNNMRIVGPDTFLDMRPNYYYQDRMPKAIRGLPLPDWRAGNSVHGLHIMKVAAEISGDPRLKAFYEQEMILNRELDLKIQDSPSIEEIIDKHKGLITKVARAYSGEDVVARAEWMRSDISLNLQHMALHDLTRLERDPGLRATYQKAFRREHAIARGEANTFWNYLYASQIPGEGKEAADGIESLRRFPTRKVIGPIKNSDDPALPKHKGLRGDMMFPWRWFTDKPLPYERRALSSSFPWQNNPYKLDGNASSDDQGSGTAYLVAYWLGRYHGYVSPKD